MASAPIRSAVLVLNCNGRKFLADCLGSLARLDVFVPGHPGTPIAPEAADEVWLVDNGSTDGSVAYVRERFPWVRVMELGENLGFSEAYNRAVAVCPARWVAFLNNDTRVAPDWLSRLLEGAARHPSAGAVASCMLSWDGTRIDFDGGDTFFFGQAYHTNWGQPWEPNKPSEKPLLFGCAGALLVERQAFLEIGGFDSDYFSFFEDVDLGWRLNLAGREVWFCPQALVFHRGQGSWGTPTTPRKRVLLERNGLANVFKNWDDPRVGVFLLLSEIHTILRGLTAYGSPWPVYPPKLSREAIAHVSALAEFSRLLPKLGERRKKLAAVRVRRDEDLLPLFGSLTAAPSTGNPTFACLYRRILWRLELAEGQKLPQWSEDINEKALAVAEKLASLCQRACSYLDLPPTWWESPITEAEATVPLLLARTVFALRGSLERFLLQPLDLASLSWLAARIEGLQEALTKETHVVEMDSRPPATVVVRTQNRPAFLQRALASIAGQSQKPAEVVVVNDGGEDPSPVLSSFAHTLAIRLVSWSTPRGRSAAAQAGLLAARGAWVNFLDDDDQLLPQHLEILSGAVASGARVAYTDVEVVKTDASEEIVATGVLSGEFDPIRLLFENYIPIMGVLFPRDLALSLGGFDTTLEYFEDWDLWIRLAQEEHFFHCPVVTARYFVRPAQGHGRATSGDHRWPHMARVFDKHRHLVVGWAWAEYFRSEVEATRQHRNELSGRLDRILQSRSWRLIQAIRRVLGRG